MATKDGGKLTLEERAEQFRKEVKKMTDELVGVIAEKYCLPRSHAQELVAKAAGGSQ